MNFPLSVSPSKEMGDCTSFIHLYPSHSHCLNNHHNHPRLLPSGLVHCSSVGRATDNQIWRSWVQFPLRSDIFLFFFWPCVVSHFLTRVNVQWEIHWFISTLQYTLKTVYSIQSIHWSEHATHEHIYGNLPPLSQKLAKRRLQFASHCQRALGEIAQYLLLWKPSGPVQSRRLTFPNVIARNSGIDSLCSWWFLLVGSWESWAKTSGEAMSTLIGLAPFPPQLRHSRLPSFPASPPTKTTSYAG